MSFENRLIIDNSHRLPDSLYWKTTTFKGFDSANVDYDEFVKTLDPIENKTIEIIENINSLVSFGINFTSKVIGFDEIIKCYLGNVNSLDNKSREIVDVDTCCGQFYGKPVIGIVSFVRFPGGVIEYHKSNKALFNVSTIALMLNKASFPLYFIKELCNSETLFNIERSNGATQSAVMPRNSSIFWNESRTQKDGFRWRVQVSFNEQGEMNEEEKNDDNKTIIDNGGQLVKTIYLTDLLRLNNIDKITIEATKLKMSLRESDLNKEYKQQYCFESDSDSDTEDGKSGTIDNTDNLFVNRDKEPDIILNSYHSVIIEETIKYFESRFDEYLESITKSLSSEGISVIIN